MPTFSAAQVVAQPSQAAALSTPARFTAAQTVPAPAQAARLEVEVLPDAHLSAEQQVPQPTQRARLVLATWRGPAEPRPPGVAGDAAAPPCRSGHRPQRAS